MTHYICTGGCGMVSEQPMTCGTADCLKNGQPLEACDCADGRHSGRLDDPISSPTTGAPDAPPTI